MTPFTEIYDLALVSFNDYKLDKIYSTSVSQFEIIMKGYLLKAIPKFTNCIKDLESILDLTLEQFSNTLTLSEKTILSNLLVIEWMSAKILDVTQFNLHLNDTDFKHYAESQNLTAKQNVRNELREIVNQDMTNYGIKNTPWSQWAMGNYDT